MNDEIDAKGNLTPKARDAVNRYLLRVALLIGVPNLLALAAAFAYVFFVLPNAASNEAKAAIQKESATLTNEFMTAAVSALTRSAKAQAEAEALAEKSKDVEVIVKDLRTKAEAFKASDPGKLLEQISKVQSTSEGAKLLELAVNVKAVEDRLSAVPATVLSQGYGNGAWQNIVKRAECPAKHVAVGVEITYGGTCSNQCNADGGTVREVKLVCRPL